MTIICFQCNIWRPTNFGISYFPIYNTRLIFHFLHYIYLLGFMKNIIPRSSAILSHIIYILLKLLFIFCRTYWYYDITIRINISNRIIQAIRIRSNRIICFRQWIDRTPYRIFREILAGSEIIDFIVRNILQLLARKTVFGGIGRHLRVYNLHAERSIIECRFDSLSVLVHDCTRTAEMVGQIVLRFVTISRLDNATAAERNTLECRYFIIERKASGTEIHITVAVGIARRNFTAVG